LTELDVFALEQVFNKLLARPQKIVAWQGMLID
jgi:hypothetical protein